MEISTGRLRDSWAFAGLKHSVTATHRVEATARDRQTRLKLTHFNSTAGFVG